MGANVISCIGFGAFIALFGRASEQPTLADTAFAYACNSQGLAAVASAASIDFLRPAFAGDRLVATARVKQQGKLTGVYDIEIVNQQQKIVALFRGKSHRIGGTITGDV